MPLTKQPVNINFTQGVETKVDPFQVPIGKFLALSNSIFDKQGRLTKRNGYATLTSLPTNADATYLTTFNGNLTAIGSTLQAYNESNQTWVEKGTLMPLALSTLPLIRSSTNQSQTDSAVASNGLICTVFTDNNASGSFYKYVVADSITGQNIVAPSLIIPSTGVVDGSPRVFILENYFIIIFTVSIGGTFHLQYIAIGINNTTLVTSATDITSSYSPTTNLSWDAVAMNNNLYIAYNTTTGGQSVRITFLAPNFTLATPVTFAGQKATTMSLTADTTNPIASRVWVTYYNSSTPNTATFVVDKLLNVILAPTVISSFGGVYDLTTVAQNAILTVYYEMINNYGYDSSIPTHYIQSQTVTQSGTASGETIVVRSVGLASKAFIFNGEQYFIAVYQSVNQPSYFLINNEGKVVSKFAYANGSGYYPTGLPNVSINGDLIQVPYLIKDLLESTNKDQNAPASEAIYTQTGINLITFNMDATSIGVLSSEIGSNLNLTGGFITAYDGYALTEQGFFVWPDNVEVTTSGSGGSITAQEYFYQVTYEWTDNQGNIFRSAPSIPVAITTTGSTSTNTIYVPTLRLTYKTQNPVKIVVYRWSAAQQNYYAIMSPSAAPVLNDLTVDYVTITDTASDAQILGNPLIYTTGGVLEDISPPASNIITLFNNRFWLVDAEDPNLLWFSKQVIEATPVEMSDLLTMYIAPTTASQGSTGPITALSPMDDKLIIFKKDALGYINGIGPDNTGANNQYSDFILINSVVGCTNQKSIVFTPMGLMFQSDKGIWLIGRDLSTNYIGAPVESYTTGALVQSALNIPTTNQVRFSLDSGVVLLYDYFYQQWSTFSNVASISRTIYKQLDTFLNYQGLVLQETPGIYLDNSAPVLMSFTTAWVNLAGLQGFERFYQCYLLGTYITPFKLNVQFSYNYSSNPTQFTSVTPIPPTGAWGSDALWGSSSPWGGPSNVFEARIFPQIQKCESFQMTAIESYDPSFGIAAGAGLTLSGLNLVVGMKKGYRTSSSARSFK